MFWDTLVSLIVAGVIIFVFWKMPDEDEDWGEEPETSGEAKAEPEEAKATGPLALTALVGGVVSLFGLLAVLLVGFVSVGLPLVGLGALVGLVGGVGSLATGGAAGVLIGGASSSAAATAAQQDGQRGPTVRVRQGEPIRIFTARDLDFSSVS